MDISLKKLKLALDLTQNTLRISINLVLEIWKQIIYLFLNLLYLLLLNDIAIIVLNT